MKKGDKVTMLFHCAGVVSEEELTVVLIEGDTITTDETFNGDNGEENRKFNIKNGKCLNDSNYFGAKRTLKIE